MSSISSLKLHNYRCYEQLALNDLSPGFLVFYGDNGAGKTNILEAASLLSPGRGLRTAKIQDIQRRADVLSSSGSWAVSASISMDYGSVQVGTGLDATTDKRVVRIQGETARGQNALSDYISCIWLTPQMDRLFIDSLSHRRRFLDRLIFAFDPGHSGRVTRYENAMRQRSRLLQDSRRTGSASVDPVWLSGLEAQMAETAVAIAAARLGFVQSLQAVCDEFENAYFPRARLSVQGTLEELLENAPALEVEELFKHQLLESRGGDMLTGGAATGPHKSDLAAFYAVKNMRADQCSTGEQKALLTGIILAHARLVAAERGRPPVLLLDEVAAHLDEDRRAGLYDLLEGLKCQVWLTGTDRGLFDAIGKRGQFFEVKDGGAQLEA
jgi:DNA replication and repair protein RecF